MCVFLSLDLDLVQFSCAFFAPRFHSTEVYLSHHPLGKSTPVYFNAPYEVFSLVVDVAVDDEVFAAAAVEDDDDAVAEGAALVPEGVEAAAAAALSVVFELL